ncbi:hypothetical protein E2C01_067965 [Portunus trituberculatus]|uniref:Uncharacterized protein n=1 Tax=Portunus trituberculatus TaxID=210409 RepID=A0A5B7HMI0_PORTR|nr:hypothetical protein [Portunus trituberculatus]
MEGVRRQGLQESVAGRTLDSLYLSLTTATVTCLYLDNAIFSPFSYFLRLSLLLPFFPPSIPSITPPSAVTGIALPPHLLSLAYRGVRCALHQSGARETAAWWAGRQVAEWQGGRWQGGRVAGWQGGRARVHRSP